MNRFEKGSTVPHSDANRLSADVLCPEDESLQTRQFVPYEREWNRHIKKSMAAELDAQGLSLEAIARILHLKI